MSLLAAMRYAVSSITNINRATQILSENISSANDPDYVRRYTRSIDLPSGGVGISEIRRTTDDILQRNLWNVKAEAAAGETLSNYYSRLQELSGNTNDNTLMGDTISRLTDAFKEMEAAPTVDASRQSVLFAARAVIQEFDRISLEVFELRARINNDVSNSIDEVNKALNEIRDYNNRIAYEGRLSTITSKVENFIEERINVLAENFDIRVFRGNDKSYRIYTRNGLALLDSIPAQFSWDGDKEIVRNTLTGFDVTNELPQGRLRTQIDFIARKERVNGTARVDVVQNDDFRLGVLSKFEHQLDVLARMLVGDNSGTNQGHPDGQLATGGAYGPGVPSSPRDTFSETLGEIFYPDQIYLDVASGLASAGDEFFISREVLTSLYDDINTILADTNPGATEVDLSTLSADQKSLFRNYFGTVNPGPSNFDVTLTPAAGTVAADQKAARADVQNLLSNIQTRLEGIAVPPNVLRVGTLQDFILKDGSTVAAPTTPQPLPAITLDKVRELITDINDFISDPTANPLGTATGAYSTWSADQRHLFRRLVNEVNPDVALSGFAAVPADPNINLSMNELKNIVDKISALDSKSVPPTGSTVTSSLEHYWSDKMFIPQFTQYQDKNDITRFNIKVNENLPKILEGFRFDSKKIGDIVASLLKSTRDVNTAGLSINDKSYAGVVRDFGIDTARRASESDRVGDRTAKIKDTLELNYQNTVGVNLDAEMSRIVVLQNSYAATARVITTVTRMFETLEKTLL